MHPDHRPHASHRRVLGCGGDAEAGPWKPEPERTRDLLLPTRRCLFIAFSQRRLLLMCCRKGLGVLMTPSDLGWFTWAPYLGGDLWVGVCRGSKARAAAETPPRAGATDRLASAEPLQASVPDGRTRGLLGAGSGPARGRVRFTSRGQQIRSPRLCVLRHVCQL